MKRKEIEQQLFRLLKNIAPDTEPKKLGEDENIREVLDIDSFDYLNFIVGVDEVFGIETPERDYGKVETLRGLVDYIQQKVILVEKGQAEQ